MAEPLGFLYRRLGARAFSRTYVEPADVERVKRLARSGAVVYVMRYRSVVDYMLAAWVFRREELPLAQFANDVAIAWFRPVLWVVRRFVRMLWRSRVLGRPARRFTDRQAMTDLLSGGNPVLVFLRAHATGFLGLFRRRRAVEARRIGSIYLQTVLRTAQRENREVFVVPVAPCRGRGYRRRESRLSAVFYSVREAPNELKKFLASFLHPNDVSLKIGPEVPLRRFLQEHGQEREPQKVRRLERELQLYLTREERVVWGPTLLPKHEVREIVLGSPEMRALIARVAQERDDPYERVRREAAGYFNEMAANFNGSYFAIVEFLFYRIWPRLFRGVEITGLEAVADKIRQHPVVLVPCHRSYFDFVALTYIFHIHFLSPPHIAAGVNMSFFPMGPLFRGAGAFFIRRTFGDNELYKAVFREYLAYLIREGYPQEFFIEGGRSRTGKILTPRLGMLSAIVDAFIRGIRRDLYFVPVSISYERLVEEEMYKEELRGGEKPKESFSALLRARNIFRRNYGKVHVNFAEPISLADAMDMDRPRFRERPDDPDVLEEKRRFTLKLGFDLLREVNRVAVIGAPSIAATVLLSSPFPAVRYRDFVRAAYLLVEIAEREGAHFTSSLERDRAGFRESIAFLEGTGAIARVTDEEDAILHVPDEKRLNLDFHKNNSIHLFLLRSLLAQALLEGVEPDRLADEARWWLQLFRNEFVLPEPERLERVLPLCLEEMRACGALRNGQIDPGHLLVRVTVPILANFREAYWVTTRTLSRLPERGLADKALRASIHKNYEAQLLLGVCRKPEGNNTVTLENAVNRLSELDYVRFERRGRGGRDQWILAGERFAELPELERRLARSVTTPVERL